MALLAGGIAGATLNLTVRDSHQLLAPVFYALPLPVAGSLLLAAAVLFPARFLRRLAAIAGVATLGWWFFHSYGWAFPAKSKWKAATWNIARPKHPFASLIEFVRAERPDAMVLVESGHITPDMTKFYEDALPGYQMVVAPGGLSCLVRGRITQSRIHGLANNSMAASFRAEIGGARVNIFAADLGSFPLSPRAPQIDALARLTRGERHTLVMGDFNTPLESVHLRAMRASFVEAREGPSHGFRETWLYNVPLLSLDQIWCSRDLRPVFSSRRVGFASDHSPLVMSFDPVPGD